jgi:hypothetical protein
VRSMGWDRGEAAGTSAEESVMTESNEGCVPKHGVSS